MSAHPQILQPRLIAMTQDWLPRVLSVEQATYSHPWSRENFESSIRAGYLCQVLAAGPHLIGYTIAMKGSDEVHLLNLTVAPAHQQRGWARFLLESLGNWTRLHGAEWIWLEVRKSNARALKVYEAHGFEVVGERPAYYPLSASAREDAIVMSRRLV